MAKKSSTARQSAARRTQAATRAGGAMLVRPEQQNDELASAQPTNAARSSGVALADAPTTSRTATTTSRVAAPSQPVKSVTRSVAAPAAKPAPPTPAAKPTRSATPPATPPRHSGQSSALARLAVAPAATNATSAAPRGQRGMAREQSTRLARARATQRTRTANLISPEHFNYVLTDLRLIVAVAVLFTIVLIVLRFVMPQ